MDDRLANACRRNNSINQCADIEAVVTADAVNVPQWANLNKGLNYKNKQSIMVLIYLCLHKIRPIVQSKYLKPSTGYWAKAIDTASRVEFHCKMK